MRIKLATLLRRTVPLQAPASCVYAVTKVSPRKRTLHRSTRFGRRQDVFSMATCRFSSSAMEQPQEQTNPHDEASHHVTIKNNGKSISILPLDTSNVKVDDEEALVFHASWLWVNDPNFVHPTSGQKLRTLGQYRASKVSFVQIKVVMEDYDGDNSDEVDFPISPPRCFHSRGGVYQTGWEDEDSQARKMLHVVWDSGEESMYDLTWLIRCRNKSGKSLVQEPLSGTQVTKDIAIGARDNPNTRPIHRLNYQDVLHSDEGRFQALHHIMEHGAILIQNAPYDDADNESTVATLGRHLSASQQLSHGSLYGDVFHVQSMPNAHNIAYTSDALPPHQDLTYYESKPFLQLLHCAHDHTTVAGGESVLVDSMAAAEELRTLAPDLFDALCEMPATFLKQREGADMVSFKPHIVTDSIHNQVVSVHWSPPFEGPLIHVPDDKMEAYVCAYQALECMLNDKLPNDDSQRLLLPEALERQCRDYARQYTWEYALQHGEILVFNNQRMVHARRSFFVHGNSPRHLIGCYTDAMDTICAYRILLRERNQDIPGIRNAGNGYLGM